jgi:hypothetical protein
LSVGSETPLTDLVKITDYQQQLGKLFEKLKKEGAGEELTNVDEEWKQLKEETAEHTVGYQPKPENRVWFDEE